MFTANGPAWVNGSSRLEVCVCVCECVCVLAARSSHRRGDGQLPVVGGLHCRFAHAFLAGSRSPSDVPAPSALRGAGQALVQATSTKQLSMNPATAVAAAGVAVLGSFAVSARRGAGERKRASKVVCNFSKESQLGAQAPLGFFDPAGFCENEEKFKDLRAKELKHGRLAMMGALGMLTQSLVQVPGMEDVPEDVTACLVGNGQVGFIGILAIIAGLETAVFVQNPAKEPGNFGNPLPWWNDYSDEMRSREINNGRIAMFSAIGIIASGLYTGQPAIEQLGL
mmetsp:Transcript_173599/g.551090  ORF Transcript_173599/g.551090 Transcript_173599/m.551090 type:complete len:282 (+) Transcript_173599:238-1083(+)